MIYEIKGKTKTLFSYTQMGNHLDKLREELAKLGHNRKFEIVKMPLDSVVRKK